MPPGAAYVHVPFCRHHCGYCNFTVLAGRDELIESYLKALEIELTWLETPRPVESLFIGGGTPTHLPPRDLHRLLALIRKWFPLAEHGEFSVEANPGDVRADVASVLNDAGVNRVSLGAQSFRREKLRVLERDHQREDIERAISLVRDFASLSLDLIFGAPGEALDEWRHDLDVAVGLHVEHISTYGLTFEKGTTFWNRLQRGELSRAPEEVELLMYETAIDRLTEAAFEHYEVSNFARPGRRCRHNEVYWAGDEYYAAGPGAARYVEGWRETNHRSTTTYLRRVLQGESPTAERERLSPEDRAREALVLGLRRREGISLDRFVSRFGFEANKLLGREYERLIGQGLLEAADGVIRLTRSGLVVSDAIWPGILRC